VMSLEIIYKGRTVPTEGGHPERPEPSKPGRGHKYATPVSQRRIRTARKQAAEHYTRSQALRPGFFLCMAKVLPKCCARGTGPGVGVAPEVSEAPNGDRCHGRHRAPVGLYWVFVGLGRAIRGGLC